MFNRHNICGQALQRIGCSCRAANGLRSVVMHSIASRGYTSTSQTVAGSAAVDHGVYVRKLRSNLLMGLAPGYSSSHFHSIFDMTDLHSAMSWPKRCSGNLPKQ